MIYTIFLSTYSVQAYAAIHPIVIKSHVIRREILLFAYHGTITTRKGPELYNKLLTAFQEASIPKSAYKIRIEPPLEPPEGSDNKHSAAPRVKYPMPHTFPLNWPPSDDSNPEGVARP